MDDPITQRFDMLKPRTNSFVEIFILLFAVAACALLTVYVYVFTSKNGK